MLQKGGEGWGRGSSKLSPMASTLQGTDTRRAQLLANQSPQFDIIYLGLPPTLQYIQPLRRNKRNTILTWQRRHWACYQSWWSLAAPGGHSSGQPARLHTTTEDFKQWRDSDPGSASASIRIRIQEVSHNKDPCGSASKSLNKIPTDLSSREILIMKNYFDIFSRFPQHLKQF